MGTPAKRRTKQQKRERASHIKLEKQALTSCPKCKKPIRPHFVCKFCGYYKGTDILSLDTKAERKKKKQKKREDKAKGK
ncbi:MAG: 50S ribosomal protein L32 [Patescibacteria group bacterium]